MTTKVLNLYAGIGGNRKRWTDVDVTAVEWDGEKAEVYRDHFPDDMVVEADAHEYLLDHYDEYDFIWASPPCPTHSEIRKITSGPNKQNKPKYPDMKLYEEILFLKGYAAKDWVVENVKSWYDPLIKPQKVMRHYFWSNFHISDTEFDKPIIEQSSVSEMAEIYGYDLSGYDLPSNKKRKMLRNCVHPRLGEHVFNAATSDRQTTLV
jgi:DNA (cytosine-5)-methyltransferase 1